MALASTHRPARTVTANVFPHSLGQELPSNQVTETGHSIGRLLGSGRSALYSRAVYLLCPAFQ